MASSYPRMPTIEAQNTGRKPNAEDTATKVSCKVSNQQNGGGRVDLTG